MYTFSKFLIVNHLEMNIPLEETAQEVVLSSFPWFPENIWSSVRAWKNHGHISSHVSVWMWMEVVTFRVSFLLPVDIGITLQVHQQSKKKWECCHWGLLVIKLSACVKKRYLKGLVILIGPKNPEETYFFFPLEKIHQQCWNDLIQN